MILKEEPAKRRLIVMMQKEGCIDILDTEINSLASVNCSVSISLGGTLDIWEACEWSSNWLLFGIFSKHTDYL